MSVAMAVFIGIQVYWIKNSLQLREANFRRSIDDAVNGALLNLETIEFSRRTTSGSLKLIAGDTNLLQPQSPALPNSVNQGNEGIRMAKQSGSETETLVLAS